MTRSHLRSLEPDPYGREHWKPHTSHDPFADDYDDEEEEQQDLTPPSDDHDGEMDNDDHDGEDHVHGNTRPDESDEESEDEQPPQEELSDATKGTVRRIAMDAKARALEEKLQRQMMEGESFERVVAMQKHMAEKASRNELRRRQQQQHGALARSQSRTIFFATDAYEMVRARELAEAREYAARARKLVEDEDLDDEHQWEHGSWRERSRSRSLLAQILFTLSILFGIISMIVLFWNSKYGDTVEAARIVPANNTLGLDSLTHWSFDDHEVARTNAAIESIYDDAEAIFNQIDHDKEWLKHYSLYRLSREYIFDIRMAREQPSILNEMNADFVSGQKEWLDHWTAELDKRVQRCSGNSWATSLWEFWMTLSPIPGSYSLTSISSIARLMQKHVRVQETLLKELETKTNDLDTFLKAAKIRRQALRTLIEAELQNWENECKAKQIYPIVPAGSEKEDARPPYCKWARPDVVGRMLSEMSVMRDFSVVEDFVEGNKGRYEEVGLALRQTGGAAGSVGRDKAYKSMGHPRQAGYVAWVRERVRVEGERLRKVGERVARRKEVEA
ncbi:hypothetical protein EJ03DRAFT_348706 [Teratosphaeria nubilosa]|uniref:Uncharacterized protein n=1 Tax=Teratosphaeria nubilosa TaxID=161662 RepID=A0A6G1LHF7_9PEZI|nr:hypothetical protein EJ03DRAFT_348706 [Teratosphaeria nubilosa]